MPNSASQTTGVTLQPEETKTNNEYQVAANAVSNCFCVLQQALETLASTSTTEAATTLHLISGQVQLAGQFFDQIQVSTAGSGHSSTAVAGSTSDEQVITQDNLGSIVDEFKHEFQNEISEIVFTEAYKCGIELFTSVLGNDCKQEKTSTEKGSKRLVQLSNATTQTSGAKLYKRDFMTTEQLEHQKLINSNAQLVKEVKALRNLRNQK